MTRLRLPCLLSRAGIAGSQKQETQLYEALSKFTEGEPWSIERHDVGAAHEQGCSARKYRLSRRHRCRRSERQKHR